MFIFRCPVLKNKAVIYSKLKSLRKVALLTNISKSTISRWNIVITPVKRKSKYDIIRPLIIDIISTTIKLNPFFTILDIQNHVKMACNINCYYGIIRDKNGCKNIQKI